MIYSYVSDDHFGIIKLHTEQVYTYIADSAYNSINTETVPRAAILTDILSVSTLIRVKDYIKSLIELPPFIILDFKEIFFSQKNLDLQLSEISIYISTRKSKLLIINAKTDTEVHSNDLTNLNYLKSYGTIVDDSPLSKDGLTYDDLIETIYRIRDARKNKILLDTFIKQEPPFLHESSSIYLHTYFDFKGLIKREPYTYYSLYELAYKIINKNPNHYWEVKPNSSVVIFCQTLNGAFIGSILSDILGLNLYTIDHLGPINKNYNNKRIGKIEENVEYLVVSDVYCLGTEVKNAKSIIEFAGGKFIGCLSYLRIETREERDIKFKDYDYYYFINNEFNPVNYRLSTALDSK